ATILAATYLATLAWAGHAAAGEGEDRWLQLAADVVHLLAAGAWVGALPALVLVLRSEDIPDAARTTQRFSTLGIVSVGALAGSGFVNAWYLVGNLPALIATPYGQILLFKL